MPGDVLLICAECGCASNEHAAGWAAFTGEDPKGIEPTSVVIMCPVCAARELAVHSTDGIGREIVHALLTQHADTTTQA